MKTLIITGGMIEADFALSFIQELKPDYILGVDKGLQFCYEYDIRPDYIVGDFDSLPGEILERYRQEGEIPIRTYNPVRMRQIQRSHWIKPWKRAVQRSGFWGQRGPGSITWSAICRY